MEINHYQKNKLYEYTRSIRFFIEPIIGNFENINIDNNVYDTNTNNDNNIEQLYHRFMIEHKKLIDIFEKTLFYPDKENKKKLNRKIKIKYKWINKYTNVNLYNNKDKSNKQDKKYTLEEIVKKNNNEDLFQNWIDENKQLILEFNDFINRPQENKARNSDILILVKKFKSREYLQFVDDLSKNISNKDSNKDTDKLEDKLKEVNKLINNIYNYLNKDNDIEIARGSFNFYTINKTPKYYNESGFDEVYKEKKENLNKKYKDNNNKLSNFFNNSYKKVKEAFINFLNEETGITVKNPLDLSIDQLYKNMKEFRAKQKSKFYEYMQKIKESIKRDYITDDEFKEIQEKYPLFADNKEVINNFLKLDKKSRKELFPQRVYDDNNKTYFKIYYKYCEIYKDVAIQRGKIIADLKNLEIEKIESTLTQYLTYIIEINGKKCLFLIHKKNDLSKVRENLFMKCKKINDNNDNYTLYEFNSITERALDKLVRKNNPKEIPKINKDAQYKIKIYKDILQSKVSNIKIDKDGYDKIKLNDLIAKEITDINTWRKEMEKITYAVNKYYIKKEDLKTFCAENNVIIAKITAYDFERKIKGEKKEYTQVWEKFWDQSNFNSNYLLRINPEIKIFLNNKRKNKDKLRYVVTFSITENAATERVDLVFKGPDKSLEIIKEFKKDVIDKFVDEQNKKENLYYYGIDRGNIELATLCVCRFTKKEYEYMNINNIMQKDRLPIFPNIEVYRIKKDKLYYTKEIIVDKKDNKATVSVIENPSFFMDDGKEIEEIFEKEYTSIIDLTTAKLIKGKIILNGDLITYMKLKEKAAKRKIFDIWDTLVDKNIYYNNLKQYFYMKVKNKENKEIDNVICYYTNEKDDIIRPCSEMRKLLQEYIQQLKGKKDIDITIENINNLRDAITSNIVGIIHHLFEQYPGIINMENLHEEKHIAKHFASNNMNIARRLEWGLYKKFQKENLVPPTLKDTIFLRENQKEKLNNIGIIFFVKTKGTSAECPRCGTSWDKLDEKDRDIYKFKERRYTCINENCKFDTKENRMAFEPLKSPDDVAAYNIAKFGFNKKFE